MLTVLGLAVTRGRAKRLSGSLCLGTQLGHLQTVAAAIAAVCPELISRSSRKSVLLPPRAAIPPPWPGGPSLPTGKRGFSDPGFPPQPPASSSPADRVAWLLLRSGQTPQRRGRRPIRMDGGRRRRGQFRVADTLWKPERSRFQSQSLTGQASPQVCRNTCWWSGFSQASVLPSTTCKPPLL